MKAQIKLGEIRGIKIGLHYSWLIIAVLIALSLANYFRGSNPDWSGGTIWTMSIATVLLFFLAIVRDLFHGCRVVFHGFYNPVIDLLDNIAHLYTGLGPLTVGFNIDDNDTGRITDAAAIEPRAFAAGVAGVVFMSSRPKNLVYRHNASAGGANTHPLLVMEREHAKRALRLIRSGHELSLTATIGVDHIDTAYLQSNGIVLASAPGCNANAVAEYVLAGLLELSRHRGFSLKGKSVGAWHSSSEKFTAEWCSVNGRR